MITIHSYLAPGPDELLPIPHGHLVEGGRVVLAHPDQVLDVARLAHLWPVLKTS